MKIWAEHRVSMRGAFRVSNWTTLLLIALALIALSTSPAQAQIISNAPTRLDPDSVIDGRDRDIDPKVATDWER